MDRQQTNKNEELSLTLSQNKHSTDWEAQLVRQL